MKVNVSSSGGIALRLQNLAASAVVVAAAILFYCIDSESRQQLSALFGWPAFSFTGQQFLLAVSGGYLALLALYYFGASTPEVSKSLRCLQVAGRFLRAPRQAWQQGLGRDERVAVLATLLKAFFVPIMVMSLMSQCLGMLHHGLRIQASGITAAGFAVLFDRHGFWFLMQLIIFVDVLIFTVGYLIELPRLRNQIRSVDPTLLGWAAALACYPPFNVLTGMILGSQVSDFPKFDDPTAHLVLNGLLLLLMALYAWASVAMGFKASNLTHRGIVDRGPYRFVRHPAYVCKNLAWWIGAAPLVMQAFGQGWFNGLQSAASVAAWTMLYVLRAMTEEDHLRSVDGEYAAYAARVRWRFVPGIF